MEQINPRAATTKPVCLGPAPLNKRGHHNEEQPLHTTIQKTHAEQQKPAQPKNNIEKIKTDK